MAKKPDSSDTAKTQKQIQSQQTRRRIVEAAAEVFVSKGFEGSSIADLARATQLTKGAIYHHFDSKGDLFFAVIEMVREQWYGAVVRDVLKNRNGLERIGILIDNHAGYGSKMRGFEIRGRVAGDVFGSGEIHRKYCSERADGGGDPEGCGFARRGAQRAGNDARNMLQDAGPIHHPL